MIAEALKLNLGSRDRSMPGFQNVDTDPHPGVDHVMDVGDLYRFQDGSVAEIYSSNVLEHFPHVRTLEVLKDWARVLSPGGILYLSVPDFKRTIDLYHACGGVLNDWIVNFLYGDQGYKTAFHYTAFDFPRLTGILKQAGFSEVSQVDFLPIGDKNDCSNMRSNFDGKPVCLNIIAVKG